jgi:hypothetical protein
MKKILLLTCDPQTLDMSPNGDGVYGEYQFVLQPKPEDEYELVVCYEKIEKPCAIKVRKGCTMFIPGEPETIKSFSTDFINQFNYLLTFRDDLTKRFNGAQSFTTNCLTPWRIGLDENLERAGAPRHIRNYNTLATYMPHKQLDISMIVSNKPGTPLQRTRIKLAQVFQQHLGASQKFHLFGRGVRDIPDKSIALDNFRYSICMENSELPHYFTEKITDCIITDTIPLYWGCTNITDYFEICKNPLFMLDPYDLRGSLMKVQFILQNSEAIYNQHKDILKRDKLKIMNEYNILTRVLEFLPKIDASYNSIFQGNREIEIKQLHSDTVGYHS